MGLFTRKKTEDKKMEAERKSAGQIAARQSMKDLYGEEGVNRAKEGAKDREGSGVSGEENGARKFANAYRILIKPLVSEKASVLGAEGKYFFAVKRSANKIEVTKAIKQIYGIKPLKVNIINMKGKNVRTGRMAGQRKDWKKAIVTLPKGESIKVYEGV